MDCHFKAQVFDLRSQFGCFRLLVSGPHELEDRLRPFAPCVMQIGLKLSARDGLSVPGKPISYSDHYSISFVVNDSRAAILCDRFD
jgi:hypothetical protein